MPGKLVSRMSERKCFTLSETDTIKSASQNFDEKKVGCMPILDANKIVVGIISERDLSRLIYTEKFNMSLPISSIMSKNLISFSSLLCQVHMQLQFRPDEYNQFEAKIHNLKKQIISGSMLRICQVLRWCLSGFCVCCGNSYAAVQVSPFKDIQDFLFFMETCFCSWKMVI